MEEILVIDPGKRITVGGLYTILKAMKDECSRDESYHSMAGPGRDIQHSRLLSGTFRTTMASDKRPRVHTPETAMSHSTTVIGKRLSDNSIPARSPAKRQKTAASETIIKAYTCPFRKRNPIRFNVRDYQTCALSTFPDIPHVKYATFVSHRLTMEFIQHC